MSYNTHKTNKALTFRACRKWSASEWHDKQCAPDPRATKTKNRFQKNHHQYWSRTHRHIRQSNHRCLTRGSFITIVTLKKKPKHEEKSNSFFFLTMNKSKFSERISLLIVQNQIGCILYKYSAFSSSQNVKIISTISFTDDCFVLLSKVIRERSTHR